MLAGGRFTLPAESRYSPTEGECLAVAVGLEQSKFYTLGCPRLYIATDHKPLVGILCDRALDTIGNPRIVSVSEERRYITVVRRQMSWATADNEWLSTNEWFVSRLINKRLVCQHASDGTKITCYVSRRQ